jgi:hypothetical protein
MIEAAKEGASFNWTPAMVDDLRRRIAFTIDWLKLSDSVDNIYAAFRRRKFVQGFLDDRKGLRCGRAAAKAKS